MDIVSRASGSITAQNWAGNLLRSILKKAGSFCAVSFCVLSFVCLFSSDSQAQRHNSQQHRHSHLHRSNGDQSQRPRGIFGGGLFAPIKSVTNKLFGEETDVEKTPVNPPPIFGQTEETNDSPASEPVASEARRRFRQSSQRRIVTRNQRVPFVPPQDPPSMDPIEWVGEDFTEVPPSSRQMSRGGDSIDVYNPPRETNILDDTPIAETKLNGLNADGSSRLKTNRYSSAARTEGKSNLPPIESDDPEISSWLQEQSARDTSVSEEPKSERDDEFPFVKSRPIARKQKEFAVSTRRTKKSVSKADSTESSNSQRQTPETSIDLVSEDPAPSKQQNSLELSKSDSPVDSTNFNPPGNENFELQTPASPKYQASNESYNTNGTPSANQQSSSPPNVYNIPAREPIDQINPPQLNSSNTFNPNSQSNALVDSSSSNVGGLRLGLPQVRLELNGPRSIRIDEDNVYSVRASNESIENLQGLFIRIGIPKGVSITGARPQAGEYETESESDGSKSLIWQVPSISANSSHDMQVVLRTSQPRHFALDVEWTAIPVTGSFDVQVERADLQLALEGPSEAVYGEPELYRLRIKNPGNAVARDVSIELNAANYGSSETSVGDIPPGSERIVEVELTFQETGKIVISSTAESLVTNLSTDTSIEVDVQSADLIAQWTGPEKFYQGSVAQYELVLRNQGRATSKNIECSVALPRGVEPVQVPDGAIFGDRKLTWSIPSLKPDSQERRLIKLRMGVDGDQEIQFSATGSAGGATGANLLTQVESITDLNLAVVDPVAPAPTNAPVQYELEVVNRGTKPAKMVDVIAQFSQGIEPIEAKGHGHRLIPGQVLFETIPEIGPGESVRLTVVAKASIDGMHRFRAEVTCDDDQAQLVHEESTRYLATRKSSSVR